MKRITSMVAGWVLAIGIAGGVANSKLNAQTEPDVVFTVPFAFSVEGHSVAPGTYKVRLVSSQFLMSFQNVANGSELLFSVRPEEQRTFASKGLLVFSRCGKRADLTEFHVPNRKLFSATIAAPNGRDTEVEKCQSADTTTIAAR